MDIAVANTLLKTIDKNYESSEDENYEQEDKSDLTANQNGEDDDMVDTDVEFDIPEQPSGTMQEEKNLQENGVEDDQNSNSMPESSIYYTEASATRSPPRGSRRSVRSSIMKASPSKGTPPKRLNRNERKGRKVKHIGSNDSTPDRVPKGRRRRSSAKVSAEKPKNRFYNHSGILVGATIEDMYKELHEKGSAVKNSSRKGRQPNSKGNKRVLGLRKKSPNDSVKSSLMKSPGKNLKNPDELVPSCCICYTYDSIQITGLLDCGHTFCYDCILSWSKVCNTCPLCKEPFTRVIKQRYGENIDYAMIKQFEPTYGPDGEEVYEVQNTDETCYECKEVGDTNTLLVCDQCNFRCCHLKCMDPPLDFIPASNWYCKFCIKNNDTLENNFENSTAVIFPQDFREAYRSPPRRSRNNRSRRRRATREARTPYNPLEGLLERMAQYREQNRVSRGERLAARRQRSQELATSEAQNKKKNRIKYKTKENDRFEQQERRLIEEQEVLIREHLQNGGTMEQLQERLNRSRSQDQRDGGMEEI